MDPKIAALCLSNICLLNAAALMAKKAEENKVIKKKKYSANWLLRREEEGFSVKLLPEIECEDTKLYRNILKMTPAQFEGILEVVRPYITKQATNFRNCIGPGERLQLTLRYLATGETQSSLQLPFRIQQSTISKILKQTIPAIYNTLNETCLRFPKSEQEWTEIATDFFNLWGFPNCLGAIDGKHCKVRPLKKAGSTYYNYKESHSFILMAIADSRYRFTYVDIGINGRVGDAGVWLNSDLRYAIERNEVKIPPERELPLTNFKSPYTFIADDAFALAPYMLKPYSHLRLTPSEEHFNKMLSRNRRVVENAFGILANRFGVLFAPIYRAPEQAIHVVLACVCLHNFLRNENIKAAARFDNFICEEEIGRIIETNFSDLSSDRRKNNKRAENLRKNLEKYFQHIHK